MGINELPDPGLPTEDQMDVDENRDMTNNLPWPNLNLEDLVESATLENIKISLNFIQELKTASLENGYLAPEVVSHLKNPPSGTIELTPDDQLFLELFISTHNSPQHVYMSVKNIIEHQYPESKLLSLDKVKQLTVKITGISPITDHMCIKSCVAYTGPFKALDACSVCDEPRFDSQHWLRQVFLTVPVGPLLQALRRSEDKAMVLCYRTLHTEALLLELANNEGLPKQFP
jgi:hypothetical protein